MRSLQLFIQRMTLTAHPRSRGAYASVVSVAAPDGLLGIRSWQRLQALADDLRTGSDSWALFFGAGVSAASKLRGWEAFIREAAATFNVACPPPEHLPEDMYPRLAQDCLEAAPSPTDFWALVEAEYCRDDVSPTPSVRQLFELPFELFVTTNFDCLPDSMHDAVANVPGPRRLWYPNINPVALNSRRLVHLHGRCHCKEPAGGRLAGADIVLTEDGYDVAYSDANTTLRTAIDAIFSGYNVLMVGASLADQPIRSVLNTVRQREKYREQQPGGPPPNKRYAIVASEWVPDPVDEESLDRQWRGLAMRIEPIFYPNPPGADHADMSKAISQLYSLVNGGSIP